MIFFKLNSLVHNALRKSIRKFHSSACKLYITPEDLGFIGFDREQTIAKIRLEDLKSAFMEQLSSHITNPKVKFVHEDDIKTAVYLASAPIEAELAVKAVQKYQCSHKSNDFLYVPMLMRMLHKLKLDDMALQVYHYSVANMQRSTPSSLNILLDLLYESERYNDVLHLVDNNIDSFDPGHALYLITHIATASCVQLSTPESLQYFIRMRQKLLDKDKPVIAPVRRLGAYLAYLQNDYDLAYELLLDSTDNTLIVRSLRVLVLLKLNKTELALETLLQSQTLHQRGYHTFKEVMDEISLHMKRLSGGHHGRARQLYKKICYVGSPYFDPAEVNQMSLHDYILQPPLPKKYSRDNVQKQAKRLQSTYIR